MKRLTRILWVGGWVTAAGVILSMLLFMGVYVYMAPSLPSVDSLRDIRFQVPLRVFSADGSLLAEFGEKRRSPVTLDQVPDKMVKAFLAAEDDRFYDHPGVDYQGILRAGLELIRTGEKRQGGSTITMQVARNFFLSREKTYLRKLNEIFLSLKIEKELSKREILELYLNKIYLGHRAYGVGAAAQVYYGVGLNELSLAQMAMIAGLPKAPSRYNPVTDPARALLRRDYVLRRMRGLGFIGPEAYQAALQEPPSAQRHAISVGLEASYVAEMVRADMVERYPQDAYTAGYRVYTTLLRPLQEAANQAVSLAVLDYDRRHGYRGVEGHFNATATETVEDLEDRLRRYTPAGLLLPGVVTEVLEQSARIYIGNGETIAIEWPGLSWARRYIDQDRRGAAPERAGDIIHVGDVVRVRLDKENVWHLAQRPEVQGALVALAPDSGAITALTGGFEFHQSKFNRVTQANRQPGSGFKPFFYASALEAGYTAASLINDAPVVFDDPGLENTWRPENYSGKFYGPTRLRVALTNSRNLVSIRLLRAVGIKYALDYVTRFGFDPVQLPRNLSLALGTGSVTPLELATAYAVFANGGFRVYPYYIERIEGPGGELLFEADPERACLECEQQEAQKTALATAVEVEIDAPEMAVDEPAPRLAQRVLSPQVHYLMDSFLRDVVQRGTGRRARQLGRKDLGGKTGTTNDQRDAWFSGYHPTQVAVAWVGFDQSEPLGNKETGGRAALPMWMAYMKKALRGVPEMNFPRPPHMISVRIDPVSGLRAGADTSGALFETFRVENVPPRVNVARGRMAREGTEESTDLEGLF